MIARYAGATLGLFAFFVVCAAGVFTGNPVGLTMSRAILALFLFCVLGFVLGYAAQLVVAEHEAALIEGVRRRHSPGSNADEPIQGGNGVVAKDRGAVGSG